MSASLIEQQTTETVCVVSGSSEVLRSTSDFMLWYAQSRTSRWFVIWWISSSEVFSEIRALLQAGMEGLVRGLLKFDPCRGHKLSSLLVWWIRESVSSLATTLNHIVRIPKKVQFSIRALSRTRNRLRRHLGR